MLHAIQKLKGGSLGDKSNSALFEIVQASTLALAIVLLAVKSLFFLGALVRLPTLLMPDAKTEL